MAFSSHGIMHLLFASVFICSFKQRTFQKKLGLLDSGNLDDSNRFDYADL
jgi:hypothetical protein